MKRQFLIGSVSGVFQVLVNIGLTILIVPILIDKLGIEGYGIYALITALGSVGIFTNFGFGTSLIKFLSEEKDRSRGNYDIVSTFLLTGSATVIIAALALVFGDFVLSSILGLNPAIVDASVKSFYSACIIATVFQVVSLVPSAVLDSLQKVYITNVVQLVISVLRQSLILATLLVAPDLASIGWIILGGSVALAITLIYIAGRLWGSLACPNIRVQLLVVAAKHFRYARSLYAGQLMFFFYEPVAKFLISRFVGLAEVGYFDIALRIKGLVWSVLERLIYPVLPLLARTVDADDARRTVGEVQSKLVLVIVPLLVASLFLSKPLLSVWLGYTHWPVVVGVMTILVCYLVTFLFVPLYQFLSVRGYPEKTLVLQSTNVVINVVMFAILVPTFGYYGAVTAYCLAVLTSTGMCARYQWTILQSTPLHSVALRLGLPKLAVILVLISIACVWLVENEWLQIAMLIIVNFGITILAYRLLELVDVRDIDRYVGRTNMFGGMLERMFVKEI